MGAGMDAGIAVFDTTVQESNAWLADTADRLEVEEPRDAYVALRAGLHALRDRLAPEMVLALSGQLPMLLRGLFIEGWRLQSDAGADRTLDDFVDQVETKLPLDYPHDGEAVARAVFKVVASHVGRGLGESLAASLPEPLRPLWPPAPAYWAPTGWC